MMNEPIFKGGEAMKKRILALFMSLCVAVSGIMICPSAGMQAEAESDGDTWDSTETYYYREVSSGQIEITGYTGSGTEIVIPSEIDGNTVVRIGDYAFYSGYSNTVDVTSIEIPDTVTSLGYYAFRDCNALTDITISDSVTTIENRAFDGCGALASITIPSSVTNIGEEVFISCSALENIIVDSANTAYASEDGNLYNKAKNTLVTYAPGKMDTSFDIPNSVVYIGNYAFCGVDALTEITIPTSVVKIGEWAFYTCEGLTDITIPGNVKTISSDAFELCYALESITLEEGITTIGDAAFASCPSLTEITIPASVTSIGDGVFGYCSELENIYVSDNSTRYADLGGILYTKDMSRLIHCPAQKTGEIDIPASVTKIDYWAFDDCEDITLVVMEDSAAQEYAEDMGIDYRVTLLPRYTVVFNANGGSGLSTSRMQVKQNNTLNSLPTVSRSGYTFLGWYTATSGGTKITTNTVITKNMTVYAQWKKNPVTKYTVTFNKNGGYSLSKYSVTVEKNKKIGTLPTVKRKGYAFKGWYTKKTGGTKVTSSYKVTKKQTLYAQWTKITKPKKVYGLSLKSSKTKQMTVKYKKVSGAKGYEIVYATNKKFKKYKKTTTTKTNTTIKNLSKKKTYYVMVRAYKVDSAGKKVYGSYSKAAKVKTK